MAKVDGFEDASVSVGFSDSWLVIASVTGFCVLAVSIYQLVVTRVKSADELDNDENLTHEERLAQADVSTLNRAQRRARAKAIMKEQRRAAAATSAVGDENDNNHNNEQEEEDHATNHRHQPVLSRKERQIAAKAAEKEERRLYQEERQKIQKETQQEAKRLKEERIEAEALKAEEEKRNLETQKIQQEEAEKEAWATFLPASESTESKSVQEFVAELQTNRTVNMEQMAVKFSTQLQRVEERIRQLMREHRVARFFQEHCFVSVSEDELDAIAAAVTDKGTASLSDVAKISTDLIAASKTK